MKIKFQVLTPKVHTYLKQRQTKTNKDKQRLPSIFRIKMTIVTLTKEEIDSNLKKLTKDSYINSVLQIFKSQIITEYIMSSIPFFCNFTYEALLYKLTIRQKYEIYNEFKHQIGPKSDIIVNDL